MKKVLSFFENFFKSRAHEARKAKKATGAGLWEYEKKRGIVPRCSVCGRELKSAEEAYFRRQGCCELTLVCEEHAHTDSQAGRQKPNSFSSEG
ncbi:hypothetical protein [Thermosulfuriphilus sp.]